MKMTREEAINKLADLASKINRVALVDALEALGLIKFDKANLISDQVIIDEYLTNGVFDSSRSAVGLITYLKAHGYKIERI